MEADQAQRLEYLDFELQIGLGQGREYPIAVVRSPAGEPRETIRFPFDELALRDHLKSLEIALLRSGGRRRRIVSDEERTVQTFGQALFEAIFVRSVRDCYQMSLHEATLQRKGLRIKLRIQAPELAALPWEFLYDSRLGEYICLSRKTPIVRYPELSQPIQPLAVALPLQILGMIASPSDLPPLDAAREIQRLKAATEHLQARGFVELTWLEGQTWRDLHRAMQGGPWHIFHFIGHGGFSREADEGIIALADEQGDTERLGAMKLGRLLADHDPLRLVLLNACEGARASERDIFSSTAATLVRRGIPAVVAMQYEISDEAAIEFTRAFYEAIARSLPIDAATVEARKAMSTAANSVEWGTPVLYMRAPNGVLFDWHGQARAGARGGPSQQTPAKQPEPSQSPAEPARLVTPSADQAVQDQHTQQLDQLYTQANALYWTERWEQSIDLFEQILAQDAGYRDAAIKLQRAREQQQLSALYDQALQAIQTQSWDTAIERLEAIQQIDANFRDSTVRLAHAQRQQILATLYAEARGLHQAGSWQAVINVFERIAALDATYADPEGLASSARAALAAEKLDQQVAVLYTAGLQAVDAGDWPQAQARFEEIQRHKPSYAQTDGLLARVERELKAQAARQSEQQAQAKRTLTRLEPASGRGSGITTGSLGRPRITPENAKQVALLRTLKGHTKPVNDVAFSPDGQILASCSGGIFLAGDKAIKLWKLADGSLMSTLAGHAGTVSSVAFAPDGEILASASDDKTVRLWRVNDGNHIRTLAESSGSIRKVVFAPDGQMLASPWNYRMVRLWRTGDGEYIRHLTGHSDTIWSVAFAPDGLTLASASADKTIRLWQVADGKNLHTLSGHSGVVFSVAFAPDGQTLASASADKTIRLWRVEDGAHLATLTGHSTVRCVTFAPDGRMIASAYDDKSIRLWRVEDGTSLYELKGHASVVRSVAFSPDGSLLASGSDDQTVRIWAVAADKVCPTCLSQVPFADRFCSNCGASVL